MIIHRLASLLSVSLLGNIISFLSVPILARMYGPDVIGSVGAIISAMSLVVILATFRLELGVAGGLPAVRKTLPIQLLVSFSVSLLSSLILDSIHLFFLAFLQSVYLLFSATFSADDRFHTLSITRFFRTAMVIFFQFLLFFLIEDSGFLVGLYIGLVLVCFWVLYKTNNNLVEIFDVRLTNLFDWIRIVRPFFFFNVPYSFLVMLVSIFPIIYFSNREPLDFLGFLVLADRLVGTPFNLISQSMRDVLLKFDLLMVVRTRLIFLFFFGSLIFPISFFYFRDLYGYIFLHVLGKEWLGSLMLMPYIFLYYSSLLMLTFVVVPLIKAGRQSVLLGFSLFQGSALFIIMLADMRLGFDVKDFIEFYYAFYFSVNCSFCFLVNFVGRGLKCENN